MPRKKKTPKEQFKLSEPIDLTPDEQGVMSLASDNTPGPTEPGQAEWWDVSNDRYHKDQEWLSLSTFEPFLESIPLFEGLHITHTIPPPYAKPTAKDRFYSIGSMVHLYILEPEKVKDVYVVEDHNATTKEGRILRDDMLARERKGQLCLFHSELLQAADMAANVSLHKEVKRLLEATGRYEQGARWIEPQNEIKIKVKYDKIITTPFEFNKQKYKPGVFWDLKIAIDPYPQGFSRAVDRFGYAHQAMLYQMVRNALFDYHEPSSSGEINRTVPSFNVCVGKNPPYEVVVYKIDDHSLMFAKEEIMKGLNQLKICRKRDIWPSRYRQGVFTATLPPWRMNQQ